MSKYRQEAAISEKFQHLNQISELPEEHYEKKPRTLVEEEDLRVSEIDNDD